MKDAKTMKEILAENLELHLAKKGLNQTDMARDLGFPETTVSNWMKGETYPRPDRLQMMADYFSVRRSNLTEQRPTNIIELSQRTVRIPVLGVIACGDPILAEANYEDYRTELEDHLPTGRLFYLKAKGDSMHPEITDGSMVLLREQHEVENGEIAAVMINRNEEATLKRIKKQDGMMILMPVNPEYEPIFVTANNPVQIIGKVIRSERTH